MVSEGSNRPRSRPKPRTILFQTVTIRATVPVVELCQRPLTRACSTPRTDPLPRPLGSTAPSTTPSAPQSAAMTSAPARASPSPPKRWGPGHSSSPSPPKRWGRDAPSMAGRATARGAKQHMHGDDRQRPQRGCHVLGVLTYESDAARFGGSLPMRGCRGRRCWERLGHYRRPGQNSSIGRADSGAIIRAPLPRRPATPGSLPALAACSWTTDDDHGRSTRRRGARRARRRGGAGADPRLPCRGPLVPQPVRVEHAVHAHVDRRHLRAHLQPAVLFRCR
jgi:hypothetical protein